MNQKPVNGGPLCSLIHPSDEHGAKYSELTVHKVESVKLCGEAAQKFGPTAFESWIELKTGRTHQVNPFYRSLNSRGNEDEREMPV